MSALATFSRSMQRYEKRACKMGIPWIGQALARDREAYEAIPESTWTFYAQWAAKARLPGDDFGRRRAFLYERAEEAVKRLHAALNTGSGS